MKTKAAKTSDKKDEVKETKKAKKDEAIVEEVDATATETVVETAAETAPEVTAKEAFVEQDAKNEGEIADAKNASVNTTAVLNETKPADEVILDRDEELERQ